METREAASRFRLVNQLHDHSSSFAGAVTSGLTAKTKSLPCQFLYDEIGSRLFEEICALPEYYLTRSERQILESHASEIVADLPDDVAMVELGSGSATKTELIIASLLHNREQLRFHPIDVSRSALEDSACVLLDNHPKLEVIAVAAEYERGLEVLRQQNSAPEFVLWLGSSIGNLSRSNAVTFLRNMTATMRSQDRLLIGIDLRKPAGDLERAYDDAAKVTARFNLNLLERINAQLGGQFDLGRFQHSARYNADLGRVEMHLVSTSRQHVRIDDLGVEILFEAGESIHTENSYKYSLDEINRLADSVGLTLEQQWFDQARRFSLNRFLPRAPIGYHLLS